MATNVYLNIQNSFFYRGIALSNGKCSVTLRFPALQTV
jgi:hypothetical protein